MLSTPDKAWKGQYPAELASQRAIMLTPHLIDMELTLLSAERAGKRNRYVAVKNGDTIHHIEIRSTADR
jgi:hypothetical protein